MGISLNIRRGLLMKVLVLCLFVSQAGGLRAAVQIFSVHEAATIGNFSSREIQLPQFNPGLGALESVTVDFNGTGEFFQGFGHASAEGVHRALTSEPVLTVTLGLAGDEEILSLVERASRPTRPGQFGGVRSEPVTLSGHTTLTSSSDLMQFTGCGMIDLFMSTRTGPGRLLLRGANLPSGLWATGANISVIYTYTAVPETAATWVAGLFALAIAALTLRTALFSKS